MTLAVFSALLSHWRRQPFQLLTLVLGLSLATALWSGVQAINAEARKSYGAAADVLGGGGLSELRAATDEIPMSRFADLRRAGWLVSPVLDGWLEGDRGRVRLMAIDVFTFPPGSSAAAAIQSVDFENFIAQDGTILAAPGTAERLRREYGDRVISIDALTPGLAIMDLVAAQRLLDRSGVDRFLLAPDQPLRQAPLSDVAPELHVEAATTSEDLGRLTDSFHLNLTAFGLLSFAVGLFIVNGAVGLAFEQRRSVFRTLRALGVTSGTLVTLLCIELLVFALLAGALGVLLGYLIAAALLPDVAATLRSLYGASVEGALTLSPLWWLSGLGIAVLGTALASATGLLRVARLAPLAPAKPRAWAMATDRAMRGQLGLAAICAACAFLAWLFGSGLVSGFVLLGGLLLAAALALPAILSKILAFASGFARKPLYVWFWADTRQQLPGLSLALMALLLALAANIGVGTMVESFRLTFTGWLDQRLASELYVSAETEEDTSSLIAFLEPRTEAILPIWRVEGDIMDAPGEIFGIVDHPTYRENWPLLAGREDTWDLIAQGEGVLINEQLARREDLTLGEKLPLPNGLTPEIVGIYSDYGNPLAQAILPNSVLAETYPDADRSDFGLRVDPERVEELKTALREEFGLPEENMVDQQALKSLSLQIFERTFAVTGVLNILTLAVAGVAILTSLLTLSSMRLPQLAPIWALGVTRRTLGHIELLRAIILAALTFALSIPLGLGLAWILLTVINLEAFGWRLPMFLFPWDWVRLGLLSLAAAGLASLWPAWRLATRPPSHLIRLFANER
jgi:putative ABC transport system permease protein